MKRQMKYDVYGIGHALVDIQYSIGYETVTKLGIDKGVMTMIDDERRIELTGLLPQPVNSASGGSAANTMIAIAGFGGLSHYACLVGDDEWGAFYHRDLAKSGVGSTEMKSIPDPTGQCIILVTPDADRTMSTFLGASANMGPDQLEPAVIGDSKLVYLEGYLMTSEPGVEACIKAHELAREQGTAVSLTLSDPAIIGLFRDRFNTLIDAGVDLLLCNEDEALALTETSTLDEACTAVGRLAPAAYITCGADGAVVIESGAVRRVAGVETTAVDTTGAGDAFAGGVLFGITRGHGLVDAAKLGSYAGSRVVSAYGPRLEESLRDRTEEIITAA